MRMLFLTVVKSLPEVSRSKKDDAHPAMHRNATGTPSSAC
jgi:hypothetical protein